MRLALSILVFWLGMACVYLAFHGFTGDPANFAQGVEQIPDSIRAFLTGEGPSALSGSWTTEHAVGTGAGAIGKGAQALAQGMGSSAPQQSTTSSQTVLNA